MKNPHQQRPSKTVRLTIDFPEEQHTYLKMLAAKSGVSMKQFVINALSQTVESRKGDGKLGKNKFKKLLKETVEEYDDVLRRLADK